MSMTASTPSWLEKNDADNASAALPNWAMDFRQQQWDSFIEAGLPSRKNERFKYTDFSFLAHKHFFQAKRVESDSLLDTIEQHRLQGEDSILLVLVNGFFIPTFSDLHKLPKDVIVASIANAMQDHAELIKPLWLTKIDSKKYPFAGLNAAQCTDGLFIHLPKACHLSLPIHLLSIAVGEQEFIAHPRHVFVLGEESKLTLVEDYIALSQQPYLMNVSTQVVVEKSAELHHCKLQKEGEQATHLSHLFIHQKQDSNVTTTHFATGATFARDDVIVRLQEPGAHCRTGGFYHLQQDNQYIDYHLDIAHAAPRSNSEMLYKGILDKKSRAVFNGRLLVEKDAQKILAYQANHNLLLSNDAEVYSKPELEIYADDVKCKHGASTGQIDQEAIFYLCSRGIPKSQAIIMLLRGFADEILQRLNHTSIRMRAQEMVS